MSTNQQFDPLRNIKFKGYCRSQMSEHDSSIQDLVNHAKFFLCKTCKRLWKDEIWDTYTNEEILIEYFSYSFDMNEQFRKDFELQLNDSSQTYGDVYDWLLRKVEENQREMRTTLQELPEKVSFSPSDVKEGQNG